MIDKAAVIKAIMGWPGWYETRDGRKFKGGLVSEVATRLREDGWKRVPRLDRFDLRDMGLEVVEGTYTQRARPTGRYVYCVVVEWKEGA